MTTTNLRPDLPPADLPAGGERAHHRHLRLQEDKRLARLVALPLPLLLGTMVVLSLPLVAGVLLEYPLVQMPLQLVLTQASDGVVRVATVSLLVLYVTLWHAVGHRAAAARQLSLSVDASRGRRLNPGFGLLGVVLLVVQLAVLVFIAVRRALALAEAAAAAAESALVLNTLTQPTDTQVAAARSAAWSGAFWPDLAFTAAVMLLLAMTAMWSGVSMVLRVEAVQVGFARWRAHRAGVAADSAANTVDRLLYALATQEQTARDRATEALVLDAALPSRFERAKQSGRLTLARVLGRPDATSAVFPPEAP